MTSSRPAHSAIAPTEHGGVATRRRRRGRRAVAAALGLVLVVGAGACSSGETKTDAKGGPSTTGAGARCATSSDKPLAAPSADLKKWIPTTVDGETLTPTEMTKQLAASSNCIRSIAGGQLAASGAAPGAPAPPKAIVVAMNSTDDNDALFSALIPGAKSGVGQASSKTIDGRKVDIRTFDLAALTGGPQPPAQGAEGADPAAAPTSAAVPLPQLILAAFRPNDDTVVFVASFVGPELADKLVSAAIKSHG